MDIAVSKYLDVYTANNGETARSFTLNLAGHTIYPASDYKYSDYSLLFIGINQDLTIIDEAPAAKRSLGTGKITAAKNVTVGVYGNLNLVSGIIENTGADADNDYALVFWHWDNDKPSYPGVTIGSGTVSGGTVTGTLFNEGDLKVTGGQIDNLVVDMGTAEVTGGEIAEVVCGAKIGTVHYATLPEAVAAAQANDTIVLIRDAEFSGVIDNAVTLDLNGKTLTGEVAATLKMNGGTLVTTNTPHTMAAPTGAKYNTTDAIIAIEPNGNITIVEGTVTLGESWWTGEGQILTIADDATFKIPAGLNLNVLSTVKVLGNVEIEGTITLYSASATIESATEIANVVTSVADHKVAYHNNLYKVYKPSANVAYRADVTNKADREGIAILLKNVTAYESMVVKVFHNDTLLVTTTRREADVDDASKLLFPCLANTTANIVAWGKESGSWINVWEDGIVLSEDNVPNKVEIWVDGVLTETYINPTGTILGNQLDKYLALDCVTKYVAQIGEQKFETLKAAVDAAQAGETIVVLSDIELTAGITIAPGKTITLDLNGKTISGVCSANQGYLFSVENTAKMTIKDSSDPSTGKITFAGNNSTGWIVAAYGDLVLESGTLELTGTWNIGYAVDVRPNAWGSAYTAPSTFTMNGGEILSSDGAVRVASSSYAGYENVSASFTMNGGYIDAVWDGIFVQQSDAAWDVLNVVINGGTIESDLNPVRFYGPAATSYVNGEDCVDIKLNGGTLTYTGTEAREWLVDGILRLGGGITAKDFLKDSTVTASESFAATNVAEGYKWLESADGYILTTKTYVAQIGSQKFESLQAAVDGAVAGDTIVVLKDINLDKRVNVTKSVTIDLNGKTITADGFYAMYIYSKTEGIEVTVKNGSLVSDHAVLFVDNYVEAGTVLNVYDCNIKNTTEAEAIYIYDYATVNIYSGTFETANTNAGEYFVLNIKDSNRDHCKFNVYGGTFVNFNPADNAAEGTGTNFCADGYTALPDLNGNFIAGSKPDAEANNLGAITVPAGDYMVYGGGSNTEEMPLNFVMQYLAKQTEADMATSPFADWYGDFVLTFTGIEDGSFVADNCYLAGYYGEFGWVKVPVDGMVIENGAHYPVMLGVGMGQKYEYICSGVQDFRCALYLDPAIFEANPNMKITLELNVVDNSKGENAAAEALINGQNVYEVTEHIFGIEHFMEPVAQIGETKYYFLEKALEAYNDGDVIVLLKDVDLGNTPLVVPGVVFDLNGNTLTGDIIATIKMNGGRLTTTQYKMAGPDDAKYITTNAVFALDVQGNLTLVSGEVELSESWRTLPGQQLTIAADATFTVPAGMDMLVLGNVKVEGTVVIDGSITLGNTNATVEADADLNVVSGVDGYKVTYKNGTYSLIKDNVVAWNVNTGVEYETVETAVADAKAGETVQLLCDANATAFFVWSGITLDLNGYKLTAYGIAASFADANIIDSSDANTGLLVIPEKAFSYHVDNKQVVLKTDAGFRFVNAKMKQALVAEGSDYRFWVGMDASTDMLIADLINQYGAANLHIQIRTIVSWETDRGYTSQKFCFKDQLVDEFIAACCADGGYTQALWMKVLNANGLTNLAFTAQLVIMDANGNDLQIISGETVYAS